MRILTVFISFLCVLPLPAFAFCGFYVAKADGELFNEASKVVFVRDGNKSTITMSSDYRGAPKDFAMIVPTPKVLKRTDVRTVKTATIDHLDAYSAPRLVEYFDRDPCIPQVFSKNTAQSLGASSADKSTLRKRGATLGVTIKAQYAVGIYDILILAARQSDGLVTFLKNENYNIPDGANDVLGDYIKKGMKFFVARVNLKRKATSKSVELEPLQISFTSRNFMLPLQLGKINSAGTQDMLMMAVTRTGQVETKNYKTKKIPSNFKIPSFVKKQFGSFYKSMFTKAVDNSGIVMEYAWDMAWCDPCAAEPLSSAELKELGVDWLTSNDIQRGQDVFVTRLHARYSKNTMMKDLQFKHTKNRENFQGRYIMNQVFKGPYKCDRAQEYIRQKRADIQGEAQTLIDLTGWPRNDVQASIRQSLPKIFWN